MKKPPNKIGSILFICTGNSCRSVMAEGLMRSRLKELGRDDVKVHSAGARAVGDIPPTHDTIEVMKEAGVDVSGYRTKNVTREMIRNADLILTMEPEHKDEILNTDPQAAGKTFLLKEYKGAFRIRREPLTIEDPIGKGIDEYRKTRGEIRKEIERIADKI